MKANFLQYLDEAILGKVERTLVWRVTRFGIGILPLLASHSSSIGCTGHSSAITIW